jgi:hypothetical protein
MSRRLRTPEGEYDWWDIETAFYVEQQGIDPEKARLFVILRWMILGDFRPLEEAIRKGGAIDDAILGLLAKMISERRLKLLPKRRGRPKAAYSFARNFLVGTAYEDKQDSSSDEAVVHIAQTIGMSEQTVRRAVTQWRKTQHNISDK